MRRLPTVTRTRTRIEYYDLGILRDETGGDHLRGDGDAAAALRRGVDSARGREMERRGVDLVFRRPERAAVALPDRAKGPAITERARHPQSGRVRRGIFPRRGAIRAFVERAHERHATLRLRDDHLRLLRVLRQPSPFDHLADRLPDADRALAAAGRIDDRVGQPPAELFGDFVAHRLHPLDAIRLTHRRDVEEPALLREL